jgi:eukaryotic-like serine/threonine-protein kinase
MQPIQYMSGGQTSSRSVSDAVVPPPAVDVGPRYRIGRLLGQGGMAQVYEAVDLELDRPVAIKVLRRELMDERARARFLREGRAGAALTHPHACQLYEVAEHDGHPFLVMELLDGEPLSARLSRGGMPFDDVVAVMTPLMDVVAAFHQQGLVHRDLKPSNVFLTKRGVKLLDFGLARQTDRPDALTATLVTSSGAVTGTMRYMAPEQITGDPIDGRADIFALGVLLFEMLTGRIPFDAATNIDWLNSVLKDDPPSLGIPALAHLDPIVVRALQRRPQDRYDTVERMAAEFRDALDKIQRHSPAPAVAAAPRVTRMVVLPFRVPSDASELVPLMDGIPEALTAMLAQSPERQLVSNRLAQAYGETTDLVAAGKALEVDQLVTGSLLRGDDEVRVTAQLVDAAAGTVLWSVTTSHRWESAMALQDTVCAEICAGLDTAALS